MENPKHNETEQKQLETIRVDIENLAVPELHMEENLDEDIDDKENIEEEIDFSGAVPEIHFHSKKNQD